jgi:hypothetical protein
VLLRVLVVECVKDLEDAHSLFDILQSEQLALLQV